MFERCLAVLERTVPPDHPAVGTCLHNAALALRQAGRAADADALAARAEAIDGRRGGGVGDVSGGGSGAPSIPGASSEPLFGA